MKSTRDRILQTLLDQPSCTIQELAEAVSISPISVRHHLNNLKADGLVTEREERHGVGRPRLVYLLTEHGREQFPTRYLRLTNRLLDQLKESLPEAAIHDLFARLAANMATQYAQQVEKLSLEQKLDFLKRVLAEEGFAIEWDRTSDHYIIREVSCPYYHIGQKHPEVCLVDQSLISTILSIPAEKVQCILRGDGQCAYAIPIPQEKPS